MIAEIVELKKRRNAIIMAHNYQLGEVQDIADFVGDSLELARKSANVESDVVVFCGVHFMAETAAILSPDKTVLLPDQYAGCPMADMITGEQLRQFKAEHPGSKVLCYVNSTAEVKAESDICVTSANAVKVARSIAEDQPIIFVPDRHLGAYTAEKLGREFILWPGFCPTHARLNERQVTEARARYPDAVVLVHPESPKPVRDVADEILSTGGMCRYARESSSKRFIIGTEVGIIHRLQKESPEKEFYPLISEAVCPNMKKINLEKVLWSLRDMETVVKVEPELAAKARHSIDAMLAFG